MSELRHREFCLKKALEAESRAENTGDPVDRQGWHYIAKQYRSFADRLAPLEPRQPKTLVAPLLPMRRFIAGASESTKDALRRN